MKRLLATGVVVIVILTAVVQAGEPPKVEVDPMQGTWAIESCEVDGNSIAGETLKTWQRIVVGNRVTWKQDGETFLETDIKSDASKKPMTLDSTILSGDSKGQLFSAIYELADGVLKVCSSAPGNPRPTIFSADAGTGQILFTARRIAE